MSFDRYLIRHLHDHPSMQPQDVVKLCYQAAYGAEHLLADADAARRAFDAEFEAVAANGNLLLAEAISDTFCRVNLASWKAQGFPAETLFMHFLDAAKPAEGGAHRLKEYLSVAEETLQAQDKSFSMEAWQAFRASYEQTGMPAVHHSEAYRCAEHPAYRIVRRTQIDT